MRLPESDAELDGPNMTPVIDMVFLLLIFFLCATRFDQEERELTANLPEVVQAEPLSMPPQEIVVNVTREGQYVVMQQTLTEEQLAALLGEASLKNPGTQAVLIRGDAEAAWRAGVRVMGLCNRASITNYRVAVVQEK
ncbi:MAG TPA: biopolymer transporter ExbD [Pirellulales bacterium]|jgi:biopolymer transport protein ExbD|nr:biopolymer transporter ExbD [Pirellulales bacterium]